VPTTTGVVGCAAVDRGFALVFGALSGVKTGFESTARVRIVTEGNPEIDKPHHIAICEQLMVEYCLSRDGGKLRNLKSFDEIPMDDIGAFMADGLEVTPQTDDGTIIEVRLVVPDKNDSYTVVNNLVATYEESLL